MIPAKNTIFFVRVAWLCMAYNNKKSNDYQLQHSNTLNKVFKS